MLPTRITKRVALSGECLLWTGPLQRNGYSYTRWRIDGRWGHARVHRLYFEECVGPIPEGLEIDHICKNKACVNPEHLRAVTHSENLLTRDHRGPAKTEACKAGHAWSEESTYRQPNGYRACRICRSEAVRRHRKGESNR